MIWPPTPRIELDGGYFLRQYTESDGEAVARAVGSCREHLRPWMPWAASDDSIDADFQRTRLAGLPELAARNEEWQYGLFSEHDAHLHGSFGVMTRRGPGTLEIGYWLHPDACNRGLATKSAGALTDIGLSMPATTRVLILCDEANARSAAIPRRLGFRLAMTRLRDPVTPGETGREQWWERVGRADHSR